MITGFYIICFFSVVLTFFGFYQWYHKTQKYLDINLEKEAKNDNKEIVIHKMQFEKEFEVYKELWENIVDLKFHASLLRMKLTYSDGNETEKQRKEKKLTEFSSAYDRCLKTFEKNKPFYPKEVYDQLAKLIMIAYNESHEYKYDNIEMEEYWKNANENKMQILNLANVICEKIRDRIGLIQVKS